MKESNTNSTLELTQAEFSSGDLGTLQEILFGRQMAAHSKQIASLQTYLEERLSKLQENCDQQFAELKSNLDAGLNRVSLQVEQNDKKQINGIAEVSHSLDVSESKLMAQLTQAGDSHGKIQGQLEAQIKRTNDQLSQSMQSSREEILERLDSAIANLDAQKLDKGALSSLLGDVATQLTGQPKT